MSKLKTHLEWLISENGLMSLAQTINKPFHMIISPGFGVSLNDNRFIKAGSLSLRFTDGFLNIRSGAWADTDAFMLDCYEIIVDLTQLPYSLEQQFDLDKNCIKSPVSTIDADNETTIIKIDVYDIKRVEKDEEDEESSHYDKAIVFTCSNDVRFSIAIQDDSIEGSLIFTASEELIKEILKGTSLRATFDGANYRPLHK